ncbi:alpha/beta hydrolase [Corynebacterium sp. SFY-M4]|uniref:alpha/beta hydrolase family protein n=1 Tax=Corynebacterium sp. SFY-M4 TaxID=3092265 RepID=UPI00298D9D7E|nr:alpha/beta hydrolase [Corynebacterium sp. SFY-M4]
MKKVAWGILYVFIVLVVAAVTAYYFCTRIDVLSRTFKNNPDSYSVVKDLKYGDEVQNDFDLYLPKSKKNQSGKTKAKNGSQFPLVVWIHGGGFVSGDKKDAASAKDAATRGYVSASVNYTTNTDDHPSNLDKMYTEIKNSVNAAVAQATQHGYPVNQMAITGESAGGTLAMMYAFRDGKTSPVPLKFVFQEVGPASFQPEDWADADGDIKGYGKDKKKFLTELTGVHLSDHDMTDGSYRNLAERVSPYHYVSSISVPILMAYGKKDKIVPFKVHDRLLSALNNNHVHYDYLVFPRSGHGLYSDPGQARKYVDKLDDYYDTYFD